MRNRPPGQQTQGGKVSLPLILEDLRNALRSIDYDQIESDIQRESQTRLAIVGPVNAGKSTLFNTLEGKDSAEVSPIPGTTRVAQERAVGPFVLVDTPGFGEVQGIDRANIAADAAAKANASLLLIDGSAGLRQGDSDLLGYLLGLGRPVVVALNKIDLLGRDTQRVADDAAIRLGVPVYPISAKKGTNIAEKLIPALVDALPDLAVALGRELPSIRRSMANKVIAQSAALNTAVGAQPIPFIDIPVLISTQIRMVLRIAAIYGEPFNVHHARELIGTIAGGLAFRYMAQQGARLVPAAGWAISAGIAAVGTFAIGRVALEYFDSGKSMSRRQMREMYKNMLKRDKATFEKETAQ
jgi:small GTP-binding protein